MRAGKLRHRVILQQETVADDDTVAFTAVATLWADVTSSGGREFWETKRLVPDVTHQVEIRYRRGVTQGMRFVFDNRVLAVQSALDPDERRIRLLCMCQELVQPYTSPVIP